MSLLEEVAFLKQAYQGLQSNFSEPLVTDELAATEKKQSNVSVEIYEGESLALQTNLVVTKQENTCDRASCETEESSDKLPSRLLGELPNELNLVAVFSDGENTGELPELYTEPLESMSQLCHDDCSTSELVSESDDELSSLESNNQSKIPIVKSESLDRLLSSSPKTDESKDSLAAPVQLTGAALARRLNVSPSTLRHKKNARNFGQWTSGHDPDGIAWYFDGQQFVSVLPHHQSRTL